MQGLKNLFDKNKKWAAAMKKRSPQFFRKLAKSQHPNYFWIGCADSRVCVNQTIESLPGQIFVHRNIANLAPSDDVSVMSSLQFAVDVLAVQHIIVCGHYSCGGVLAALQGNNTTGAINSWLKNVVAVREQWSEIFSAHDEALHWDLLCELNTLEQVLNIARTDIVQKAWQRGQAVAIHGWIYQINNGLIEDLHLNIHSSADGDAAKVRSMVVLNSKLRIGAYFKERGL